MYTNITEKFNQLGFARTKNQVEAKIKNLHQYYKDIKCGHKKSGYSRDNWSYFDLIDAVLGDRPSTRPLPCNYCYSLNIVAIETDSEPKSNGSSNKDVKTYFLRLLLSTHTAHHNCDSHYYETLAIHPSAQ